MVLAGVLCAVGIVVPMFMPRIVLGPMSFTLASHVAVFLGMFISPAVAVAVCIGTTLGFSSLEKLPFKFCNLSTGYEYTAKLHICQDTC